MSGQQNQAQQLTTKHNESANKLDYFILGVTLAICAYLSRAKIFSLIVYEFEFSS